MQATRFATEAGEFHTKAEEEGGKAYIEESDSGALGVEAEEVEVLGEDKLEESKSEETLAVVDEGVSINYHLGSRCLNNFLLFLSPFFLGSCRGVCFSSSR